MKDHPTTPEHRAAGGRRTLFPVLAGLLLAACAAEPGTEAPAADARPEPGAVRPIKVPSGPGAMAPNLAASRSGSLLSWLEPAAKGSGHTLFVAELEGERWGPARPIVSGEGFFANWADLPAVVEAGGGTRFAHWLRKLGEETYAYGAALARTEDGGETWREIGLLHDDDSPTEHGFVSYVLLSDGSVQAFWLDGRAMAGGGAMQLRTTRLGAGGPEASMLLDERVCECCSTDAALAAAGPVVAYRDRGPSEVRDIAVVRADAGGWSEPATLHDDGWQIHGCPVNGPAIAAEGERVSVAWFTMAGAEARVQVAFSSDGGASFGEPIVLDEAEPLGRVDIAFSDGEGAGAIVAWLASAGEGAEIRYQRVAPGGAAGPARVVAATTASRSAGVPRMLRHGDRLVFAWVEDAEPSSLRTGFVLLR